MPANATARPREARAHAPARPSPIGPANGPLAASSPSTPEAAKLALRTVFKRVTSITLV